MPLHGCQVARIPGSPGSTAPGEVRRAQVFVAVLGPSNLTYAEARWTQWLPDWIGCHVGGSGTCEGGSPIPIVVL